MSWRDGTHARTAKSIAQFTISDTFDAPDPLKLTSKTTKIKKTVEKLAFDPPSPDSPLKHLASIVLLENEKEELNSDRPNRNSKKRANSVKEVNPPKKRKRIRAPSPPLMSWNTHSTRRTNTSASTELFADEFTEDTKKQKRSSNKSKKKSKSNKKLPVSRNSLPEEPKKKRGPGRPRKYPIEEISELSSKRNTRTQYKNKESSSRRRSEPMRQPERYSKRNFSYSSSEEEPDIVFDSSDENSEESEEEDDDIFFAMLSDDNDHVSGVESSSSNSVISFDSEISSDSLESSSDSDIIMAEKSKRNGSRTIVKNKKIRNTKNTKSTKVVKNAKNKKNAKQINSNKNTNTRKNLKNENSKISNTSSKNAKKNSDNNKKIKRKANSTENKKKSSKLNNSSKHVKLNSNLLATYHEIFGVSSSSSESESSSNDLLEELEISDSSTSSAELLDMSPESPEQSVSSDTASSNSSISESEGPPIPFPYITLKKNICVGFKPKKEAKSEGCHCFYLPDIDDMACGTNCMNRVGLEECNPKVCPCGEHCLNQRFQKCQYCKLKLFYTKNKGFGILADQKISEGDFVIEYVGEVIDFAEFRARMDKSKGQKNFYIITIGGGKYVDATRRGNLGRFINHSCNPNCKPEIWQVRGQKCVGIFAIRDIQPGEEVTFDYRFERMGTTKQKCHCGASNCRGYLGAKPPAKPKAKPKTSKQTTSKKPKAKAKATPAKSKTTKPKNKAAGTVSESKSKPKAKPKDKPTKSKTKEKTKKGKQISSPSTVKSKRKSNLPIQSPRNEKSKSKILIEEQMKQESSDNYSPGSSSDSGAESEIEVIVPFINHNPARRVLADAEFSGSSHFSYVSEFENEEIPDSRFIKQQKIFLVRNLRKTSKYWTRLLKQ